MAVTFKHTQLDNGLTIIAETDPTAHSAAAGFFVKAGARDEASPVMGVSHFLEHMMFKGTPTRSAHEINRDFDLIGARSNAYTSAEMTCFHATVLPERLLGKGNALDILSDMLRPALRQEDFDTEKNVILEEIAMYDDNPFWILYERALEVYFGAPTPASAIVDRAAEPVLSGMHALGHRVLGTRGTIGALTSVQMREYFQNRYSADNTVVALAGQVDFDAAVDQLGRACGGWSRTNARRVQGQVRHQDAAFELRDAKVNRAYALMITPGPSAEDDRRHAASLLAHVLGGSDNSRLHWALIETGLAEHAEAGFEPRDGVGDFMVFASCDPARLDEVWSIVERQLADLASSLTEDDLAKIRSKMATGVTVAGERPGGRMQRLGRQWTYLGKYTTLEEELEKISSVRVADLRALVESFPFRPRTVGRLLPAE